VIVHLFVESSIKLALATPVHRISNRPPLSNEELWYRGVCQATVNPVLTILQNFASFTDEQLKSWMLIIYPIMCDLTLSDEYLIRKPLRELLLRVGKMEIVSEFTFSLMDIDLVPQELETELKFQTFSSTYPVAENYLDTTSDNDEVSEDDVRETGKILRFRDSVLRDSTDSNLRIRESGDIVVRRNSVPLSRVDEGGEKEVSDGEDILED